MNPHGHLHQSISTQENRTAQLKKRRKTYLDNDSTARSLQAPRQLRPREHESPPYEDDEEDKVTELDKEMEEEEEERIEEDNEEVKDIETEEDEEEKEKE